MGGSIQAYVGYITLPDDFTGYCIAGVVTGLMIGHWVVVLAALPSATVYSGYAIAEATAENALWQIVWVVFVPAALLSLAAGVAVRKVANAALRRWLS